MKYLIHVLLSIILPLAILSQPLRSGTLQTTDAPNVYAVIVGISSYLEPGITQLQFANRDAEIFASFLKSKAGGQVPESNIRLLTDSAATTVAVYNAIYWLKKTVKKDDLVYFYFSGHGDLESITMFNDAYLICYNSPSLNYVGNALSVDYLNKITNTLSAETNAKVVLITDACHSGKVTDAQYMTNKLVGEKLMATQQKEIRIASCTYDQLSNENADWGGGRGVFSYYLVNGLKGLADKSKDGTVSLGEIKSYLEDALQADLILKSENKVQTPVFKGDYGFSLSKVDKSEMIAARTMVSNDSAKNVMLMSISQQNENTEAELEPEEYFFSLFEKERLEKLTTDLNLDELNVAEIPFALIKGIKSFVGTDAGQLKLTALEKDLRSNGDALYHFNERLVVNFDTKVQAVINQYLNGDEAELERRRYYNAKRSGYDVYPKMLSLALKLTQPDNFFYNILNIKLHYFAGVAIRIKVPFTANADSLIDLALAEQKQALALEPRAAYIYNELGILYMAKNNREKAEANFLEAARFSPRWAIPQANLAYLYTVSNQNDKGFEACRIADSLQMGLPCVSNNFGLLYGNSGNFLLAEEYYRASIDLNSRHYLPFQRLGFVYLNTAKYALADSFFIEAELRKKGLYFRKGGTFKDFDGDGVPDLYDNECEISDADLPKNDPLAFFYSGMKSYFKKDTGNAVSWFRKVIDLDKKNPLAFHYLGKIYYEQGNWAAAELMFKYALDFKLDSASMRQYCKAAASRGRYTLGNNCLTDFFYEKNYEKIEDYYFLGTVYEQWEHFDEAEEMYKVIIKLTPKGIGGYLKCWRMLEKLGRFTEAEHTIKSYEVIAPEEAANELSAFYKRVIEKYPDNVDWNYRLGLFLYNRAALASTHGYLDSIIWFPNVNKEIFVDTKILFQINSSKDYEIPESTYLQKSINELGNSIFLPGTLEYIKLAAEIYTPRKDGIKYLTRAAELIADQGMLADIYYKIGKLYVWAGSKKQAYPAYLKSLELYPDNSSARQEFVAVLAGIYKNSEALAELKYLYNRNKIDFAKKILLAEMEMFASQYDSAKKIIAEAEAIHPYRLDEFDDLKGRLNMLSNKPDAAIEFYKNYAKQNPGDANTCYTIARLYAGLKKDPAAFNWLEQAIKNGFNYRYVLSEDPMMENLRNTVKWNKIVPQDLQKNKKPKPFFISEY